MIAVGKGSAIPQPITANSAGDVMSSPFLSVDSFRFVSNFYSLDILLFSTRFPSTCSFGYCSIFSSFQPNWLSSGAQILQDTATAAGLYCAAALHVFSFTLTSCIKMLKYNFVLNCLVYFNMPLLCECLYPPKYVSLGDLASSMFVS
jgi:hypothetical protein